MGLSEGLGLGAGDSVGEAVGSVGRTGVGLWVLMVRTKSPLLFPKISGSSGLVFESPCAPGVASNRGSRMKILCFENMVEDGSFPASKMAVTMRNTMGPCYDGTIILY